MKKSTAEKRQKKFGLITVKEASDAFDRPRVRVNQRTDAEIDALFDECVDGQQDRFIGKTYEGGVAATLIWLFCEEALNPLEIDGYLSDLPTVEESLRNLHKSREDELGNNSRQS